MQYKTGWPQQHPAIRTLQLINYEHFKRGFFPFALSAQHFFTAAAYGIEHQYGIRILWMANHSYVTSSCNHAFQTRAHVLADLCGCLNIQALKGVVLLPFQMESARGDEQCQHRRNSEINGTPHQYSQAHLI